MDHLFVVWLLKLRYKNKQWTNREYFIIMFGGGFQFQQYSIIRYFTELSQQLWQTFHTYRIRTVDTYSRVSFCDGSFHDDSLLRPLSSRTEHSQLTVHHCRNSSVLSLLTALLAVFWCACVSSFSVLVQFF